MGGSREEGLESAEPEEFCYADREFRSKEKERWDFAEFVLNVNVVSERLVEDFLPRTNAQTRREMCKPRSSGPRREWRGKALWEGESI